MRMISTTIIAISLCTGAILSAEESVEWVHSGEKSAWETIADRFSGESEVKRKSEW